MLHCKLQLLKFQTSLDLCDVQWLFYYPMESVERVVKAPHIKLLPDLITKIYDEQVGPKF